MDTSYLHSPFYQRIRDEARAEGRIEALINLLLKICARRSIPVSVSDEESIRACRDWDVLGAWVEKATTASTTAEIFG